MFYLTTAKKLALSTPCSWITHSTTVLLVNDTLIISVKIDPTALAPGHYSNSVCAYLLDDDDSDVTQPTADAACNEHVRRGPIFEIPITVIKPELIEASIAGTTTPANPCEATNSVNLTKTSSVTTQHGPTIDISHVVLTPAQRYRRFFVPPPGTCYVDVVVTDARPMNTSSNSNGLDASSRMICLHALQTCRGIPYKEFEEQKYIYLEPGSSDTISFPVRPALTLELTLARFWNTLGDVCLNVSVNFRGMTVIESSLHLIGGCRVGNPVDITATLGAIEIAPTVHLDTHVTTHKPTAPGVIMTLGQRDTPRTTPIVEDMLTMYQLNLTYHVEYASSAKDAKDQVCMPSFPGIQNVLYESRLACQLFTVHGPRGKCLLVGDAFARPGKFTFSAKGKYTITLQLRHTSTTVLEGLTNLALILRRTLAKPVSFHFYQHQSDALLNSSNGRVSKVSISKGVTMRLWPAEPAKDSIPKGAVAGDVLTGTITYITLPPITHGTNGNTSNKARTLIGKTVSYTLSNVLFGESGKSDKIEKDKPNAAVVVNSKKENIGESDMVATSTTSEINAAADSASTAATKPPSTSSSAEDLELTNAVRDAQLKILQTRKGKPTFESLFESMNAAYPDHLPIKLAHLQHLCILHRQACSNSPTSKLAESNTTSTSISNTVAEAADVAIHSLSVETATKNLESACTALLEHIRPASVAAELGMLPPDKTDASATAARTAAEAGKAAIIDVLTVKLNLAIWIWQKTQQSADNSNATAAATQVDTALKSLQRWDPVKSDKFWYVQMQIHIMHQHIGLALKKVMTVLDKIEKGEKLPVEDLYVGSARTLALSSSKPSVAIGSCEELQIQRMLLVERLEWPHLSARLTDQSEMSERVPSIRHER